MKSLQFDTKLRTFIQDTRFSTRISDLIYALDCLKNNGDYIEYVDPTTVSYIPKAKLELFHKTGDRNKYEVKIKIGRFVSRFFKKGILENYTNPSDLEHFVNEYRSYFDCDYTKLKIVSGSDILKYYREENYLCGGDGTLWRSCMRQHGRNKFLKMYENNPVKMLVFLTEDDKVRARALLWEMEVDGTHYKIMDRIYFVYEHDVNFFKNWAQKNGYYHKLEQSAYNEYSFVDTDGKCVSLELMVKLDCKDYNYYPYLDTFKFFDYNNGILYNTPNKRHQYVLVQSDGSLEKEEECDEVDYDYNDDF